jgi:hypothetical protein
MGFAGALRNGIAIGLGSIISFFSGYGPDQAQNNLATENDNNLVQENNGLILLE